MARFLAAYRSKEAASSNRREELFYLSRVNDIKPGAPISFLHQADELVRISRGNWAVIVVEKGLSDHRDRNRTKSQMQLSFQMSNGIKSNDKRQNA